MQMTILLQILQNSYNKTARLCLTLRKPLKRLALNFYTKYKFL